MKIEKAYFVNNETYEVYELSKSKRETLEKAHPKWFTYSRDDNNEELKKVERFFVNYGKKIADQSWGNVFVGLTSDF